MRSDAVEPAAYGAPAAQHRYIRVGGVFAQHPPYPGAHPGPVAENVANEVPGDPVAHTGRVVLTAPVAQPPLPQSPQADVGG